MRVLNETFEDKDYTWLTSLKEGRSWREFILQCASLEEKRLKNQEKKVNN